MRIKKSIYLCLLLLFGVVSCNKKVKTEEETPDPAQKEELKFPKKEMRAVWLTTVWGLDWPQGVYDENTQKQDYINFIKKFKELNINTVFVQVKSMGDAIYESSYEPWSKIITGTRGQEPSYDVLEFMVDEAHKRGIEIHAWINPFRIATRSDSSISYPKIHKSIKSDWVINHEKIQIYNPAIPEVRNRLSDIVKEIITKYEVDGIHFDDYFYPAPSAAGTMEPDDDDFAKYGEGESSIEDFRRNNVNKTIKLIHDVIVETKPETVFSLSPAPNNNYNYDVLFADVAKWCKEGWIDVVIPQLYHEIGNRYNDFQSRLTWWSQYSHKAALMVGYGLYRFGDSNSPAAFQSTAELERQFDLTKRNKKVVGSVMYRAKYLLLNKIGITNKLATIYKKPAIMPFIGRSTNPEPRTPTNIKIESSKLKWSTFGNVKTIIYYFSDLKKEGVVYGVTDKNEIELKNLGSYCITAINEDHKESKPSKLIEKK